MNIITKNFFFSLVFPMLLILMQIIEIYCMLHIGNCIISLLPFHSNSFISKLFQNVMSLTYEHMCFLIRLHVNMPTLFKRLLTKEQMSMLKVNAKQVAFSMWKQL